MNLNQLSVALYTLVHKEIRRFMRIWPQTLLPPAITMSLYFVIFGIWSVTSKSLIESK